MPDSAIYPFRSPFLFKRIAALLVIAYVAVSARAGTPPAAASAPAAQPKAQAATQPMQTGTKMEADAGAALRKAVTFHREAKDLSLKFDASVYNAALDKQDEYQGRLLLKGSAKFRLEIPGGTYVSDGETFWEYHAQNRQVVVKAAKDMEDKPLPGDVLLRFLDSDPLSLAKAKDGGKEYLEMRLDPARAMKNLDSLAVLLDKADYSVHRISSRDVSGNEAKYTVTSIKRNSGLKDKEFAFALPKGAEVVDMRGE
jgi:outer membrane lipoprotein-sorting protein